MDNISVIIPAFNEEISISKTIEIAKKSTKVNDILVINNLSTDRTEEIAKENGARVKRCNCQGKGYAMEEGIKYAKNNIVVFLDADVNYKNENIVNDLVKPIITQNADFVKSSFDRITGGIVTEVVVKPLLNLVFPDMYKFSEPISGMIAAKKTIFLDMILEKDYGVDIGILIDVIKKGYKVTEVNIGEIDNLSHTNKTNQTMSKMSTEIIKAILKRANIYKKGEIL